MEVVVVVTGATAVRVCVTVVDDVGPVTVWVRVDVVVFDSVVVVGCAGVLSDVVVELELELVSADASVLLRVVGVVAVWLLVWVMLALTLLAMLFAAPEPHAATRMQHRTASAPWSSGHLEGCTLRRSFARPNGLSSPRWCETAQSTDTISRPNGRRPTGISLKFPSPRGMPMIVRHRTTPAIAWTNASHQPQKMNQRTLPTSDGSRRLA